jgi:tol-pal system protein YbgF
VRTVTLVRVVALAAALPLGGCFVSLEAGRQMQARIDRLEAQNVEQKRTLEEQRQAVRDRVEKVDQKIREVQAKIDELNQAARRSGADLGVTLTRLQDEFAKVKGELEVAQHRLVEIDKAVGGLRDETDARFTALKGQGALDSYEARQKIAALPKQDDKAAFLALAQKEEDRGEKGIAREVYEEFVRKWPSDPRSADAGFRAGELLFEQKRFREALLAYGKVAEDFPRSERAPPALLGAAESMLRLDMKDEAAAILGQVAEKYPKTDAAKTARARLEELQPAVPPAPPAAEKAQKGKAPAPKAKPAEKKAPKAKPTR